MIEQDPLHARDLQQILAPLGYGVSDIAHSADSALQILERTRPDWAVIDCSLGGEPDAIQLASVMFRRYDLPFFYTYSDLQSAKLAQLLATQPLGLVGKPFQPARIKAELTIALTRLQRYSHVLNEADQASVVLLKLSEAILLAAGDHDTNKCQIALCRMGRNIRAFDHALRHEAPEPLRTILLHCELLGNSLQTFTDIRCDVADIVTLCQSSLRAMRDYSRQSTELSAWFDAVLRDLERL